MQEKIYNEMMVHVPVCTHKEPQSVLIIADDAIGMINEVAKYRSIETKAIAPDIELLRDMDEKSFDVVVSKKHPDSVMMAHINRVLKEDGLVSIGGVDLAQEDETKALFDEINKYFKISMPYSLLSPYVAILASKEYHPTADINLQRADLTDGFEVYNSDLHRGVFAMPTYIKKAYLGIIKN